MKIVINKCYGGFSVSKAVYNELGIKWDKYGYIDNKTLGIVSDNYYTYRIDKRLIEAIKKVGLKEASGGMAELKIIEIPNDAEWEIDDYDGIETVVDTRYKWS